MHRICLYQKREPFVSHFIFECRVTFPARAVSESSSFCVWHGEEAKAGAFAYVVQAASLLPQPSKIEYPLASIFGRTKKKKKKSSHGGHGAHGVILGETRLKTGIKRLING